MVASLSKIKRKNKLILFFIFILSFMLILIFFLILPMYNKITLLNDTLTTEKIRINDVNTFNNKHPNIAVYEKQINEKLLSVNKKLPDKANTSDFIKSIEQEAANCNISLLGIKPQKNIIYNHYSEIPFKIEIRGEYFQILAFLKNLANLDRFNIVKKMNIKAEDENLHCEIFISTYCYEILKMTKKQENDIVVSNSTEE